VGRHFVSSASKSIQTVATQRCERIAASYRSWGALHRESRPASGGVAPILRWPAEWDELTVAGAIELLVTARSSKLVDRHRAGIARKARQLRASGAEVEAAIARYDEGWGVQQ
jgi:hypothetical protein